MTTRLLVGYHYVMTDAAIANPAQSFTARHIAGKTLRCLSTRHIPFVDETAGLFAVVDVHGAGELITFDAPQWGLRAADVQLANLKRASVCFDNDERSYDCWVDPAVRWNGWACPLFERAVAIRLVEDMHADCNLAAYKVEGDTITTVDPDAPDQTDHDTWLPSDLPDGTLVWAIGAHGWTWNLVPRFSVDGVPTDLEITLNSLKKSPGVRSALVDNTAAPFHEIMLTARIPVDMLRGGENYTVSKSQLEAHLAARDMPPPRTAIVVDEVTKLRASGVVVTPKHVDEWIDDYHNPAYARFMLHFFRMPAHWQVDFRPFIGDRKLFCTYQGKKFRVTGASVGGDIMLQSDHTKDHGYQLGVAVDDCTNWSDQ